MDPYFLAVGQFCGLKGSEGPSKSTSLGVDSALFSNAGDSGGTNSIFEALVRLALVATSGFSSPRSPSAESIRRSIVQKKFHAIVIHLVEISGAKCTASLWASIFISRWDTAEFWK